MSLKLGLNIGLTNKQTVSASSVQGVAANNAYYPNAISAGSSNNVRHSFIYATMAGTPDKQWSGLYMRFANKYLTTADVRTTDLVAMDSMRFMIETPSGDTYRTNAEAVPVGNDSTIFSFPEELVLNGGDRIGIMCRTQQTGTARFPVARASDLFFGEGVIASTNTADDLTDGSYGRGARFTANVSGGVIASVTVNQGGQNYSGTPFIQAYEELADGTTQKSTIGYATLSGGAIASVVITAGGSNWVNPGIVPRGGGAFGLSAQIPMGILCGTYSGNIKTAALFGDSQTAPFSSDGSVSRDYGQYEICARGNHGYINCAVPSATFSQFQTESNYQDLWDFLDSLGFVTNGEILLGYNDIDISTPILNLTTRANNIKSIIQSYGWDSRFFTVTTKTTSTDSWTTTANQTVDADFGAASVRLEYNADLLDNTISGDLPAIDMTTGIETVDYKHDVFSGQAITGDGIHLNILGRGKQKLNTEITL